MLKLLIKLFIHDSDKVSDPHVRRRYGTLCSLYGIFLNVLLFAGKYIAGLISGSVAITADAFNNLTDAGSSFITLISFVLAGKKPDHDHPFGHGRFEYLGGLLLAALIVLTGVELVRSSVRKILEPAPIETGLLPALILLAAIAVKLYMAIYNRAIGKKTNSAAMLATATDSLTDCIATGVVLISMGVAHFFKINIDAYTGLAVALFIIYAGYSAAKDTLSPLLGQAPDPELVHNIEAVIRSYPLLIGIHDLIVHDYGPGRLMVSLHVEVDGSRNIYELHDAIDSAEREIGRKFGCLATIHMDPLSFDDSQVSVMRQAVADKMHEIDPVIKTHDFRMVPGPSHTNLIFDVVVPADYATSDKELTAKIQQIVERTWENHFAVVTIDKDYT